MGFARPPAVKQGDQPKYKDAQLGRLRKEGETIMTDKKSKKEEMAEAADALGDLAEEVGELDVEAGLDELAA